MQTKQKHTNHENTTHTIQHNRHSSNSANGFRRGYDVWHWHFNRMGDCMSDYRGEMALDELKDEVEAERREIIASLEYITKYIDQNGWDSFSEKYFSDVIVELKYRQKLKQTRL